MPNTKTAERLLEARKSTIDVGAFKFTVRRPTALEMIEMRGVVRGDELLRFLVDWEGVNENDIIEHGDPHPEPFDISTAREWLVDQPALFGKLAEGILASYQLHADKLEAAAKNSAAGSTT